MKRSKQLQNMINQVNDYLRSNRVKEEGNDVFLIITHNLLQQGLYQGFNYFKDAKIGDMVIPVLAGTSDPDKFEYLQIY